MKQTCSQVMEHAPPSTNQPYNLPEKQDFSTLALEVKTLKEALQTLQDEKAQKQQSPSFSMSLLSSFFRTPRYRKGLFALILLTLFFRYSWTDASGIPTGDIVFYAGQVQENGVPATGKHSVTVQLYTSATAGSPLPCVTSVPQVDFKDGAFRIPLNPNCIVSTIQQQPNLYLSVEFDGKVIPGRTKLAAVPYAIEAQSAVNAQNAVNAQSAVNAQNATQLTAPSSFHYTTQQTDQMFAKKQDVELYSCDWVRTSAGGFATFPISFTGPERAMLCPAGKVLVGINGFGWQGTSFEMRMHCCSLRVK
ncbi:MAG: hypothetical protein H6727_14080 [Myxococcales bacterium]|nr:hypothetical protein [Myxococcales bacterium]